MIKKNLAPIFLSFFAILAVSSALVGSEFKDKPERVPVGKRMAFLIEQDVIESHGFKDQENAQNIEQAQVLVQNDFPKEEESSSDETIVNHSMFYTSHPGAFHHARVISQLGDSIEIEDGSVWTISPRDAYKAVDWLSVDAIVITPNRSWFSSYYFRLTNQVTGESVAANLSLGPLLTDPEAAACIHWIIAIDYYYDTIYLEDGSVWNMSYFDHGTVKNWLVNDTVIMGINDGWMSSSRPNILINVNMLDYATGISIN